MRTRKIAAIVAGSFAGLVLIAIVAIAMFAFGTFGSQGQQNFPPPEGQLTVSPVGAAVLFSQANGGSSFLYRKDGSSGNRVRLTKAVVGIESEATFSHSGKLVVYSFASSPEAKSSVWVVGADGSNPRAISGEEEDALHPVFSPDDSKVFYSASSFTGHYSPVVRPARHQWDVFSISVPSSGGIARVAPTQITHALLYDLQSLDAVADGPNPGGTKILISTTGYPIGALLEEFNLGASGRDKIFQPHVPGEPSAGPAYGDARFLHDGMDILFLAATNTSGGNYDYNVFSMSDVTGGQIKQLTHLKGMTTGLTLLPDAKATFVDGGVVYVLDISAETVKPV